MNNDKMIIDRAVVEQALDALGKCYPTDEYNAIVDALREALANTRSSIRSTSEYSEQPKSEKRFVCEAGGECPDKALCAGACECNAHHTWLIHVTHHQCTRIR